jgi:hypothetical protein
VAGFARSRSILDAWSWKSQGYSTNLLGTLGRDGLGFLDRLDGFTTTAAMAATIKASQSVSTLGTCGDRGAGPTFVESFDWPLRSFLSGASCGFSSIYERLMEQPPGVPPRIAFNIAEVFVLGRVRGPPASSTGSVEGPGRSCVNSCPTRVQVGLLAPARES